MTKSEIKKVLFDKGEINRWAQTNPKYVNWPVVYTIYDSDTIYVGETTSAQFRMLQHLADERKKSLKQVNIILQENANKSVCLDLEAHLIKYFAADEKFTVMNGNAGISDSDYYLRSEYRSTFDEIFEKLRQDGIFTRSIPDIVNSDLFKYSPFKSLNTDQAVAIDGILDQLLDEIKSNTSDPIVVQGQPGTGKTIVAVYLMKLIADIKSSNLDDDRDVDSMFADFFQAGYREQIEHMKFALVVPQQSLRKSLEKVFKRTPGLNHSMILSTFDLGKYSENDFDLLIVDETHRLQQRANQSSGGNNRKYIDINTKFFGQDDKQYTQLDWVRFVSRNQILLLDEAQTVRPSDLPRNQVEGLVRTARNQGNYFQLTSQMRVGAGNDYIDYIGSVFSSNPPTETMAFENYEIKFFDSFVDLRKAIFRKESEEKLSRIVAGYAWPWASKGRADIFDFELDGIPCVWNRTDQDWINSATSIDEIGSIHTVQGYDLNYAGVIVGPELKYDATSNRLVFVRENYHDKKGKENNPKLGISYSDSDLLDYVCNIYRVLATRGIKGTYLYAVDDSLRDYLKRYFPTPME